MRFASGSYSFHHFMIWLRSDVICKANEVIFMNGYQMGPFLLSFGANKTKKIVIFLEFYLNKI